MPRTMRDALKRVTKALPDGAASTSTDAIDIEKGSRGDEIRDVELLLSAPVLTTSEAPDTKTFTYDVIYSANADLSSPTTYLAGVMVQTGAAGAGAAANTFRFKLPSNAARYWGAKATGVATGAGSTKSMTLEMLF